MKETAEEKNKQTIREFTRISKNEHNVNGVGHLFDKGFIHHFRTALPAGLEGLRQVGIMMNGAFPDVVVTEEDLVASGDRVVERGSAAATHKGSMMGESPTNKGVQWSEIHIYRLKEGKICEHWSEIAMMELLQQIGILAQLHRERRIARVQSVVDGRPFEAMLLAPTKRVKRTL